MTKHLIHFLPLLLCLLFGGCSNRTPQYPQSLLVADSLAMCNPDSAVTLLSGLAPQMASAPEPVRHYYELLTIKARDKAFLPFESDSLVLATLDYYENGGDVQHLPEAYYYMGRYLSDLGDAPQALGSFQKAQDVIFSEEFKFVMMSNEGKINNLLGCIYAQCGYLLRGQHLYDNAIEYIKKAYQIDSINKDMHSVLIDLIDMGNCSESINRYEDAINYYRSAEEKALYFGDTILAIKAVYALANLQVELGILDDAAERLLRLPDSDQLSRMAVFTSIKANVLSRVGQKDSAYLYYSKLLTSGSLRLSARAHLWLANQDIKKGNTKAAIKHLSDHAYLTDSLGSIQNTENVALQNSLYNYRLREKEINNLRQETIQYHSYVIIVSLSAILFIALLVFISYIVGQNRKKVIRQKERIAFVLEENNHKNEIIISENKKRLAILEKELSKSTSLYDKLKKEYDNIKLVLQKEEIEQNLSERFKDLWIDTPAYYLIKNKLECKHGLTENEWSDIEIQIRKLHPSLLKQLHSIFDFSKIEWRITLLGKLGYNPANISILVNRSTPSITLTRRRLYNKVFLKEGTAKDWDDFVSSL